MVVSKCVLEFVDESRNTSVFGMMVVTLPCQRWQLDMENVHNHSTYQVPIIKWCFILTRCCRY